jgi:hypothetical protein
MANKPNQTNLQKGQRTGNKKLQTDHPTQRHIQNINRLMDNPNSIHPTQFGHIGAVSNASNDGSKQRQ